MKKLFDGIANFLALVILPLAAFFVFGALAAWVTFRGLLDVKDKPEET